MRSLSFVLTCVLGLVAALSPGAGHAQVTCLPAATGEASPNCPDFLVVLNVNSFLGDQFRVRRFDGQPFSLASIQSLVGLRVPNIACPRTIVCEYEARTWFSFLRPDGSRFELRSPWTGGGRSDLGNLVFQNVPIDLWVGLLVTEFDLIVGTARITAPRPDGEELTARTTVLSFTVSPEPAAVSLIGAGLLVMLGLARRRGNRVPYAPRT
jgi:hypothetical protein